ncbi:MAG TPA: TIGR02466 family protein [Aestuariivirga sp.]|nr:TIGR02466 family protein [Aestuariivirga sp.]
MAKTIDLFATRIYREEIPNAAILNHELETTALSLSVSDRAGLRWCEKHGYPGYTSFASMDDLLDRFREFAKLEKIIKRHAGIFAAELHWDMRGKKPLCDSLWVSVLPEGGSHTSHIHTNSVISGSYYVVVPQGAGPIIFEDPRAGLLMAAPPRKSSAPREFQTHVSESPQAGTLLLWESWLRHEVPLNRAQGNRISVSFNYVIA